MTGVCGHGAMSDSESSEIEMPVAMKRGPAARAVSTLSTQKKEQTAILGKRGSVDLEKLLDVSLARKERREAGPQR